MAHGRNILKSRPKMTPIRKVKVDTSLDISFGSRKLAEGLFEEDSVADPRRQGLEGI